MGEVLQVLVRRRVRVIRIRRRVIRVRDRVRDRVRVRDLGRGKSRLLHVQASPWP